MVAKCRELFLRPHYYSEVKVHFNYRFYVKYRQSKPDKQLCKTYPITFVTKLKNFTKNGKAEMFPCFGRHATTRTNSEVDDYLVKFYLSHYPEEDIHYVFQLERHGQRVELKLYEEILNESWQKFAAPTDEALDVNEVMRETVLNTIEMYNYWPNEIENIFVNEMISNQAEKP
ncbi:hypothetical protein V9T40_013788 [Parthenolecanium corni]|uniref:Uncharacterized protein n=1 Tax=Parthenolecanium corni TaxID=536013 RepID=A0AAN9TBU2_9HEMI